MSISKEKETLSYILLDYIECAIHQILHIRNIYPSILFGRTSKYGTSLYQCRHIDINNFIRRILTNTKELISNNIIKQLKFVCINQYGNIKDEIVFEIINNNINSPNMGMGMDMDMDSNIEYDTNKLIQIEKDFRISLLRLSIQLENMSKFETGKFECIYCCLYI